MFANRPSFLVVAGSAITLLGVAACNSISGLPLGGGNDNAGGGGSSNTNSGNGGNTTDELNPSLFQGATASLPPGAGTAELVNIEDVPQGLVSYVDFDGQNYLLVFGERDDDGGIAKYTAAMFVNSANGAAYQYIFDSDRRPIQIIDNGTVIDISYNEAAETFTVTRGGQSVTARLPDGFNTLKSAVFNGTLKAAQRGKQISTSAVVGGVLAPLGMVVGLILGTYTSPIWATLTIVGATATGITSAYNAAYTANNQAPPPDLAQAMNAIDALGTLTSVADLGKNALSLANAAAKSERVEAVISVVQGIQGLAEPVSQGVKIAVSAITQNGVSAALINPDLSYGSNYAAIWLRVGSLPSQNVMTYLERTGYVGEYQSVSTDSSGRGKKVFIRPAAGGTATLTIYIGDRLETLSFAF